MVKKQTSARCYFTPAALQLANPHWIVIFRQNNGAIFSESQSVSLQQQIALSETEKIKRADLGL